MWNTRDGSDSQSCRDAVTDTHRAGIENRFLSNRAIRWSFGSRLTSGAPRRGSTPAVLRGENGVMARTLGAGLVENLSAGSGRLPEAP